MNKQQAQQALNALNQRKSELEAIINAPEITPEQRLLQLFEGCVIHFDEQYPESVFFMKDGEIYFELDAKNNYIWCRYNYVWQLFETEFDLNSNQIRDLIKGQVEQRFKMRGVTPFWQLHSLDGEGGTTFQNE